MKPVSFFTCGILLSVFLAACLPAATPAPTATALPRWMDYEKALSGIFVPTPYMSGDGLCEWQVLGQADNRVFVWAMCQEKASAQGAAMSAPAVISLGEGGAIVKVSVPRDGSLYGPDIRDMFPVDLQEQILSHQGLEIDGMWAHIDVRRREGGPPLVVLANTPLP